MGPRVRICREGTPAVGRTQEGSWCGSLMSDTPPPHLCKEVVCFQWYTERQSPQIWHSKEVTCRYANPKGLGRFSGRARVILSAKFRKATLNCCACLRSFRARASTGDACAPRFQGIGAKRNSYCASQALNYLQVDSNKSKTGSRFSGAARRASAMKRRIRPGGYLDRF